MFLRIIDVACRGSEWIDSTTLEMNSLLSITEACIHSFHSLSLFYQEYFVVYLVRSQPTNINRYEYLCKRLIYKKPAYPHNVQHLLFVFNQIAFIFYLFHYLWLTYRGHFQLRLYGEAEKPLLN